MGFFILGLNHKECPIDIREKLHFTPSLADAALEASRSMQDISELVIVSTCNRVEFYGYTDSSVFPESSLFSLICMNRDLEVSEFAKYLYKYQGEEAFRHLFRVASGLDSLVVGENEILGQLRDAFRAANRAGTVHSLLYRLMEKALKIGKDVRCRTKINQGAVSIPSVAVELAEKIFGQLAGEKIMVLGTGEMATSTLKSLKTAGAEAMFVVSRSPERGERLATEFGGEWIAMDAWENRMNFVDILIASTAAPHPVVRYDQVKNLMERRRHRPLFLIDIAVPRNIEAQVHSLDDVYLYNLDDLKGVSAQNLKHRSREIQSAELLIDDAVLHFRGWLEQLEARPTLEKFETYLNSVLDQELESLIQQSELDAARWPEVRDRIRSKLLHAPHKKIKEASRNGGVTRYLEVLHALFDLDKVDTHSKSEDPEVKK